MYVRHLQLFWRSWLNSRDRTQCTRDARNNFSSAPRTCFLCLTGVSFIKNKRIVVFYLELFRKILTDRLLGRHRGLHQGRHIGNKDQIDYKNVRERELRGTAGRTDGTWRSRRSGGRALENTHCLRSALRSYICHRGASQLCTAHVSWCLSYLPCTPNSVVENLAYFVCVMDS